MENEVDPEVVKATQNLLGKYVKRPPLSEKLLKKPPFRFLHDIVTTVLKSTGFFEGLFEQDELNSENVKDRESKILFLSKVIEVVGLTTGKKLTVKPSKIVAGQEADKTNILLQTLAQALDQNLSSKDAIQRYKESKKSSQTTNKNKKDKSDATKKESVKKTIDTKKSTTNEKLSKGNDKIMTKTNKSTVNKTKEKEVAAVKDATKKTSLNKLKDKSKTIDNASKNADNDAEKNTTILQNNSQAQPDGGDNTIIKDDISPNKDSTNNSSFTSENKDKEEKHELFTTEDNIFNSSLSSTDLMPVENEISKIDSLPVKEKVPLDLGLKNNNTEEQNQSSANDNALTGVSYHGNGDTIEAKTKVDSENSYLTRIIDNKISTPIKPESEVSVVRPASVRPSSSRPGAPRPREKFENMLTELDSTLVGKVNIITENTPNGEEEDSSIVIVDDAITSQNQNEPEGIDLTANSHGHLVQQILDSQKELSQKSGKTEIEWQFGAQKTRETINQEVEQIRYNIQALSRAANPLGKLLDHLQEDVEIMRQELQQWTATYEQSSKEVAKQKSINEESLLPLHTKLKQLEADTEEKHSKINDLKVIIQKNSSRIDKLLSNGNMQ